MKTFFKILATQAGLWRSLAPASLALLAGPAVAQPVQAVELRPCHLERMAEWAECGTFEVPEDYEQPDGRRLQLRLAVLPAFAQPAATDPVFLLAGGPGQSAVGIARLATSALGPANRQRDIVLVDQRGTGESDPLDCELDFEALAFDHSAKARAIEKCIAESEADLTKYSTLSHVRDLEAIRRALGHEKIHLYGGSYGTRVAQVYLREFPSSLATVTMDGVASMEIRVGLQMGADAQRALDGVFERCREQEGCAARFPDLRQRFEALLVDLEQNPRQLMLADPASGEPELTRMDHRMFGLGIRPLLYSPSTQRLIPLLIEQASEGEWQGFLGVSRLFTESVTEVMNVSLLLAVLCTEDLAGVTAADISAAERDSFVGTAQADEFLGYCAAWPTSQHKVDLTPVHQQDVPVLLLSGGLDPATPPYLAEQVAKGLERSRHLVVEVGGHGVGQLGCVPDLIARFIETGDVDGLDASCLDEIPYPTFFVSSLGPHS